MRYGVTVALQILVLSVQVRILVSQRDKAVPFPGAALFAPAVGGIDFEKTVFIDIN